MSASVHFKGVDSVINAYSQRGVAAWSLWQGAQFLFKFEGNDIGQGQQELQTILDAISQSSNAIYTLKVYEDLPKGGKIKDKTPHDGSFNFKLNLDTQEITTSQYGALRNQDAILKRLESIEERLNEAPEPEHENKLGLIGEILNDPGVSQIVQPLLTNLLSKVFGVNNTPATPQMPMRAIAGISDDARATLNEAIKILQQHDPKLSDHLMKLATIAKEQPESFKFLLNTLDSM